MVSGVMSGVSFEPNPWQTLLFRSVEFFVVGITQSFLLAVIGETLSVAESKSWMFSGSVGVLHLGRHVLWNASASLLQAIRSTDCTVSFISQRSAVIGAFRSSYRSIVPASSCSLSGPLLHCSPVVVYFDHGHPCFRNFNSTIPVDVIRQGWK